jgi:RNA-directed DNA polymerase
MTGLLSRLSEALDLPPRTIETIMLSAPNRYKRFCIPKRSGRGDRLIAQPAREVKAIQRWLVENELSDLPIHESATAFKTGSSIGQNAEKHVLNRYLFKTDFVDFFPSLKASDLESHIRMHVDGRFDADELRLIRRALHWHALPGSRELEVCIGAPSSPFIANTLMYEFDSKVVEWCDSREIVYTRYADDLAFSTAVPDVLRGVLPMLLNVLASVHYPRVRLNHDKNVWTSTKRNRTVTGLVLANQGFVSLGHAKKRELRAMLHHFVTGRLDRGASLRLKGLIAFALDVEPDFVKRMEAVYTPDVIRTVLRQA